jgi:CRISPR-associated endonuclease/helicase Cas3
MPATEGIRGGRQIAPMLRLMNSDLILDEPDDFGIPDLYALSRLVHWAGMLGSRLLLSSATLPPAMVQGLFEAYKTGYLMYQQGKSTPVPSAEICCAWFDEYKCQAGSHDSVGGFARQHREWAEARVKNLADKNEKRRGAYISDLSASGNEEEIIRQVAGHIRQQAYELHRDNSCVDPRSGRRVSFGLARFANIDPLIDIAQELAKLDPPPGCRMHLCCYHARHPLLMRSAIEQRLDQLLNRKQPLAVFEDQGMRAVLDAGDALDHIFIVLATPVAEVGRDHDYDWAIVEPSSMRSIIQLAGRVRRHRPDSWEANNICLLSKNIKGLKDRGNGPVFERPGFEAKHFLLNSHDLHDLLEPDQFEEISSAPRILERHELRPADNLADLEHDHLRAVMLGDAQRRKLPIDLWWTTRAHLSGELQRALPFRFDPVGRETYCLMPDEDGLAIQYKRFEQDGSLTDVGNEFQRVELTLAAGVDFWIENDYLSLLMQLAEKLDMELTDCARKFGVFDLPLETGHQGWRYHPALGFQRYK